MRVTAPSSLELAWGRGRTSMSSRVGRLRDKGWQVGQCAVAAGIAWVIASDLLQHDTPFFAPIAAVLGLGTSYGQRLRRVAEVTVGVAVGVLMGDLIVTVLGSGAWQLTLIVALAMSIALLLHTGALLVTQAAVQSIVISTLVAGPGAAFTRWTDALIGGGVALVAAAVVPRAPLRRPRDQAGAVVEKIAELLRAAADSIEDGDVERALGVLEDARGTGDLVTELRSASAEGMSVIASSPLRRRHRGQVQQLADLTEPLDFALRNTRVLVRRVAVAAYRRDPIPAGYAALTRDLATCADMVAADLKSHVVGEGVRADLLRLAHASAAVPRAADLSAAVVLAQVRSIIADLLAVSGMDPLAATDAIPPPHPAA